MNLAVLISIRPKWCELIASGKKTVEIRKTCPRLKTPFKCYIYCTKSKNDIFWQSKTYRYIDDRSHNSFDVALNGYVIGEFVCDRIYSACASYCHVFSDAEQKNFSNSCMTDIEIIDYLGNGKLGYSWHISDLIIYDKPKKLETFNAPCSKIPICENCHRSVNDALPFGEISMGCDRRILRPPQSWCYVEEKSDNIYVA